MDVEVVVAAVGGRGDGEAVAMAGEATRDALWRCRLRLGESW